jgi:hypothetical protein
MCALNTLCAIKVGFAVFISFCVLIDLDAWKRFGGQRLRADNVNLRICGSCKAKRWRYTCHIPPLLKCLTMPVGNRVGSGTLMKSSPFRILCIGDNPPTT